MDNIYLESKAIERYHLNSDKLFAVSLEIIFSGFNLVPFKLHNSLGNEKADKLYMLKFFNTKKKNYI